MRSYNYFPSIYYLLSRYDGSYIKFILYISRFWILPFLFFSYYDYLYLEKFSSIQIALYLTEFFIVYFIIYDYFSLQNDKNAKSEKSGATIRESFQINYKYRGVFLFTIIIGLFFLPALLLKHIFFLATYYVAIFTLHNKTAIALRPVTYYLLYLGKHFFLLAPFFVDIHNLILFSLTYSFAYLPYYALKKHQIIISNYLKLFLSGYFLKTLFFLSIGFFVNINFAVFALLNIAITGIEFLILKFKANFDK